MDSGAVWKLKKNMRIMHGIKSSLKLTIYIQKQILITEVRSYRIQATSAYNTELITLFLNKQAIYKIIIVLPFSIYRSNISNNACPIN